MRSTKAADVNRDTYITGEANLYTVQYAQHRSMNLMVGTHTHTEFPGVVSLANKLRSLTGLEFVPIHAEDCETGLPTTPHTERRLADAFCIQWPRLQTAVPSTIRLRH